MMKTQPPHRYTVLYYKRTNKVHKHRGTSRQDGILSIAPPPLCSVQLLDNDCAAANDDEDNHDDDDYSEEETASSSYYKRSKKKKQKHANNFAKHKKSNAVIYSGVNSELAKRAASAAGIDDDEEIALSGQWECLIIAKLDGPDDNKCNKIGGNDELLRAHGNNIGTLNKMNSANQGKASLLSSSKSKNSFMVKQRGLTSRVVGVNASIGSGSNNRGPLHSVKSNNDAGMNKAKLLLNGGANKFKGPNSSTTAAVGHAKSSGAVSMSSLVPSTEAAAATAVTSGKMKKDKNGEWYLDKTASSKDDNDDDEAALASTTVTVKKTNIPSSLVRGGVGASSTLGASLMMRKRPLGSISSSSGGGLQHTSLKRNGISQPRSMMSTSLKSSSSSTTTTAVVASSKTRSIASSTLSTPNNNNFFPGAKGDKINIPKSIRDVLRPHQREGIAFLWNCVTGVSVGLNDAIVRAQKELVEGGGGGGGGASGSSSLSSMGSFDLEEEDDADVEYDDCGVDASIQGAAGGGGGVNSKKKNDKVDTMPKGAVLADEMGLGKTLMTIATIFALHRRHRDRRFIVVCPSSLVSNWAKEFDKWIGKASQPKRIIVRNGNEDGLRKLRSFVTLKPTQSEVLILSYELLRQTAVKVICNAAKIGLLVVDEGHRLKNTAGSQTLSALNSISAEARILISGTVIQNNLSEFYTLASFAVPGILGDLNTFRRLYERPMSRANQKNATSGQKEKGRQQSQLLDSITSTFVLRRTQKDVLKSILPPRQEILLFCRPTERQCQLYKSISNRASKSIGSIGGIEERNNPLMLLTEARKLCTHPSLLGEAGDSSLELSGKMIVLSSLIDSIRENNPTDKVVIISNFTSALTVVEDSILRKKNLPFVRLDGSTDNASRGPLVDSFNNRSIDHSFAFMLSSKAGGCGLNLIGANRLIMVDADWNPATDQQSMARIYRQGQTKSCFIYRLFTTGTVEEIIYQRQTQKGNLAKIANDGGSKKGSSTNASFTKEELQDCFTLKEGCKCDTKTKLGNKWSDYNGANSLRDDGFTDEPLLGVCEDKAGILSFVHVVREDEDANPADVDGDVNVAKKSSSFEVDDDDDSSLGLGSESSSEEEEFEG